VEIRLVPGVEHCLRVAFAFMLADKTGDFQVDGPEEACAI